MQLEDARQSVQWIMKWKKKTGYPDLTKKFTLTERALSFLWMSTFPKPESSEAAHFNSHHWCVECLWWLHSVKPRLKQSVTSTMPWHALAGQLPWSIFWAVLFSICIALCCAATTPFISLVPKWTKAVHLPSSPGTLIPLVSSHLLRRGNHRVFLFVLETGQCLSLSWSHRVHLTHNIPSASVLGIMISSLSRQKVLIDLPVHVHGARVSATGWLCRNFLGHQLTSCLAIRCVVRGGSSIERLNTIKV